MGINMYMVISPKSGLCSYGQSQPLKDMNIDYIGSDEIKVSEYLKLDGVVVYKLDNLTRIDRIEIHTTVFEASHE